MGSTCPSLIKVLMVLRHPQNPLCSASNTVTDVADSIRGTPLLALPLEKMVKMLKRSVPSTLAANVPSGKFFTLELRVLDRI